MKSNKLYQNNYKPLLDLISASILLILSIPISLCIAIYLYFANDRQIIFKQLRPGMNGKIFYLYKYKTMKDLTDNLGNILPDSERLTNIGRLLRKLSLDEIPQLFNVLKGDMSMIGPRPLLTEYLDLYSNYQKRRHLVKPGITGWAQINGRNSLSWNEKFQYDIFYVDNLSFLLDMKILIFTLVKVFKMDGINSKTTITMEKFTGNN